MEAALAGGDRQIGDEVDSATGTDVHASKDASQERGQGGDT
jgi:hypothetical protein